MRSLIVMLMLSSAVGAAEVRIGDDFSSYREGSAAGKGWETDAVSWHVHNGWFTSDWPGQAEAFPVDRRIFRTATVEATLVPRHANGKEWKIAGIGLKADDRDFWHLAFVEAPDTQGNRHIVELTEMRDGRWLAQSNLQNTVHDGAELAWTYNTPYRLRLALTPTGIDGKILDLDGKVLSHLAYVFSDTAVTEGRPCLRTGRLATDFDDFLLVADGETARVPAAPAEKTFPPYGVQGSGRPAPIRGTGFFQVVKNGERWWLVDPRGELFYAVGTDHVNYYAHWCQELGYAPYQKNAEKRHGTIVKWAESATQRLRQWGFNLLGAGNIPEVRYQGLAHTLFVAFGSSFSGASALVEKTTWTGFPNVFDPRWEAYCDSLARKKCLEPRKDPWLLGYFLDNELEWYGKTHQLQGIWIETMKWPVDHTGKRALIAHVRRAHGDDLQEFNRVWDQHIASWDDLPALKALPAASEQAEAIQLEFLAKTADRYFRAAAAAIRKVDPNHLIIGSRFAGNAPAWAWTACARYCDVVTFNYYPRVDMATEDLSPVADIYSEYYELVDKPMMITEWSFPALDAGLPCKHGAGMRVDTQEQKTHCVELEQHLHFRLPFLVGSDYFMWADEPKQGISDTFPEDSNYGLNNVNDEPYELLTGMFTKLNPMAAAIHAGEAPEGYIEAFDATDGMISLTVRNAGETESTFAAEIRTGTDLVSAPRIRLPGGATGTVAIGDALPAGIHVLQAQLKAEGAGWRPRGCRGRHQAITCGKASGPGGAANRPLVLFNPTDRTLGPADTVVFPREETGVVGAGGSLTAPGTADAPTRWVTPGTLAVHLPAVQAGHTLVAELGEAKGLYETIRCEKLPNGGFRIDNGVLRLENDGESGNIIDRVLLGDLLLGSYNPLLWQEPKDSQWTHTNAYIGARVHDGTPLLVDVTCEYRGGDVITAVDDTGKMPDPAGTPVRFRVTHRIVIWPQCPYIAARLVSIRNIEERRALRVRGYFFYLPSAIGGSQDNDEARSGVAAVPNYYRRSAGTAWVDAQAKARYGVVPLDERLQTRFWRDNGGGQHPDARVEMSPVEELAPGEEYVAPNDAPMGLVYGAREDTWPQVEAALDAATGLKLLTP